MSIAELDNLSQKEERGFVRNSGCLLHIMRYHNDGIIFFQLQGFSFFRGFHLSKYQQEDSILYRVEMNC